MGICFFLEGGGAQHLFKPENPQEVELYILLIQRGAGGGAIPIALTPSVYASCIESLNKGIESLPQTQIV